MTFVGLVGQKKRPKETTKGPVACYKTHKWKKHRPFK